MVQRLLLVYIVLPLVAAVVITNCIVIVLLTFDPVVMPYGDNVVVMPELELAVIVVGFVALTPYSVV